MPVSNKPENKKDHQDGEIQKLRLIIKLQIGEWMEEYIV